MKTVEQRLDELEPVVAALVLVATGAMAAAVGDQAFVLMRTLADKTPDLTADVRKVLHLIADAAEGRQK